MDWVQRRVHAVLRECDRQQVSILVVMDWVQRLMGAKFWQLGSPGVSILVVMDWVQRLGCDALQW